MPGQGQRGDAVSRLIPQHSSASSTWGTPSFIVEAAREAMGSIELDPCSSWAANAAIGAPRIMTEALDGLKQDWDAATVFCNPPGGTDRGLKAEWGTSSCAVAFWRKALKEFYAGNAGQIVFLAFSIELMQSAQSNGYLGPLEHRFSLCVPRKRIAFDNVKLDGTRTPGPSPTHGNLLVGIGVDPRRWESSMVRVGQVLGARV